MMKDKIDASVADATARFGEHIRPLIEAAFIAGFDAGREATLNLLAQEVRVLKATDVVAANVHTPAPSLPPAPPKPAVERAPRGIVDELLEVAITASPGMTTSQVEETVVAMDDRLSRGSVSNRLRHWESQGRKYRRQNARWYRIGDLPAPFPVTPSSPQGETGAGGPGLFNAADKGGPTLRAEGGGT